MDEFNSIVTTRKRNHIYYGSTESRKIAVTLDEILVDLNTIFNEINIARRNIDDMVSGYLQYSLDSSSIYNMRQKLYNLEDRIKNSIYVEGNVL